MFFLLWLPSRAESVDLCPNPRTFEVRVTNWTQEKAASVLVDHVRMRLQQSPQWYEWNREFKEWWTVYDVRGNLI